MNLALTDPVQQHPGEPAPCAQPRRWETARVLLAVGALTYLVAVAVLAAWSVLPVLLGWSSYVVQSGSMMPTVRPGDVLVSAPVDDDARPLRRGQIVIVDDPAQPGRLLSHRVARVRDDGFIITRGDANAEPDSTPVAPEAVRGRGRLLVPYVGLPQRWLVSRDYVRLVAWLALTGLALAAVATDPSRQPPPGPPRHREGSRRRRAVRGRGRPVGVSPPARVDLAARLGLTARAVAAVVLTGVAATAVAVTAEQDDHLVGATFRASTANTANRFAARPDFVAPDASAVTVYKTKGYLTGAVRPSGPYQVLANVTDTGNPPSGTASVRADMTGLTAGAASTALNSGSSNVGGTTYNYGSSPLTAGAGLPNASKPWTLTMTDVAGFSRTRGYTVTVDGTAPTAVDVQATNTSGGTPGKPELGDTFTWTFSERVDPYSIVNGWTGAARPVYFVIQKTSPNNTITVWDGATLPLGQVVTDRDRYVDAGTSYVWFNATMTQSGNAISVVLGAVSDGAAVKTVDTAPSPLTWNPNGTPYDAAGNPMSTTSAVESGTNDLDF
jgi:signal peptidase I